MHILMKMPGLYFKKTKYSSERVFWEAKGKKYFDKKHFFTKICRYLLASKTYAKFVRR